MLLNLIDKMTKLAKKNILTFFILIMFTGCAGLGRYNPATERSEFIFISTPEEVAMGLQIHGSLSKEYSFLDEDSAQAQRVERIGRQLALISDRQDYQYNFYVIDKDELNAFTVPGGSIYIYTGLLNKLSNDDALAAVLAHEIGHCAARHTVKKYQAALGYDLIGNIVLNQVGWGSYAKQLAGLSSDVLMKIVFSSYGRKDEFEADRLGIKYSYLAGYDPEGMIEVFKVLKKGSEGSSGGPLFLRSHPYNDDRITQANKYIPEIKAKYSQVSP